MDINNYKGFITAEYLMGPNSMRVLDELLTRYPLTLTKEDMILDLGCGKGLTSMVLAKETPAKIVANDLWISEEENDANFAKWDVSEKVKAMQADASVAEFAKGRFSALVSVDSYHYFATDPNFFAEKMLPLLRSGASVRIGIPGIKDEFDERGEELLSPWLKEEAYMFKSPRQWKAIIGQHERIGQVVTWEMGCFEPAWQDWFSTGHEYAIADQAVYEDIIEPYSCFVGIAFEVK